MVRGVITIRIKKYIASVVLFAVVLVIPLQTLSQIEPGITYEKWCEHLDFLYGNVEDTEKVIAATQPATGTTVELQAEIDTLEEQRRKRNRTAWAVGISILVCTAALGSVEPELEEGTPEYTMGVLLSGILIFGGIGLWYIHRFEDTQIVKQIEGKEKTLELARSVHTVAQLQLLSKLSDLREEIAKWERLGEPYFWFYPCEE